MRVCVFVSANRLTSIVIECNRGRVPDLAQRHATQYQTNFLTFSIRIQISLLTRRRRRRRIHWYLYTFSVWRSPLASGATNKIDVTTVNELNVFVNIQLNSNSVAYLPNH